LLASWYADSKCDMTGSDKNLGRSRRHGVEDRGWSNTCRVLDSPTIGMLGDVVCGLYRAHGDEQRELLGCTSKPRSTVFSVWTLKPAAPVW
jgi:hypothetical protein